MNTLSKLKNIVLDTKQYLMIAIIITSTLHIAIGFNYPYWLFFLWTMLILAFDAKSMIKDYSKKHFLFSLVVIGLLISFILNINLSNSTTLLHIWLLFQNYYVFYCGLNDQEQMKRVLRVSLYIVFILVFIYGVINLLHPSIYGRWLSASLLKERFYGIFTNPNHLGITATIGMLAGIPLFLNSKWYLKTIAVINALLQCYILLLSGCRSAQLALILIAFAYFLLFIKSKTSKRVFAICSIFGSVGVLAATAFIIIFRYLQNGRYSYLITLDFPQILNKFSAGRYFIWKSSIALFLKKPIFGVGPLNLGKAGLIYLKNSYFEVKTFEYCHMFLMDMLLGGGLFSFIPFIIWLIKGIRKAFKNLSFDPWSITALTIAAAIFIYGMLDSAIIFDIHCFTYIFWLCFGYCVNRTLD